METLTYSNPRMRAVIPDWPSGSKRVTAQFQIEQGKKGERALRQTTGATKALTYAKLARIVDGSDGLTYIAEYSFYGHINIMRGDMKFSQKIHATLGRWNCSPSSPSHSDRPQDSDHTSPATHHQH